MKFIRLLKNNSKDSSYLLLDKKKVNCKIGANGIGIKAREGDFVTPKGIFSLEKVFFRADRMKRPKTSLKIKKYKNSTFGALIQKQ
jgi:L,D-peptidoglycan transpeptidase YkuD (ErfK/YbiS/YcfS/YnhG family)